MTHCRLPQALNTEVSCRPLIAARCLARQPMPTLVLALVMTLLVGCAQLQTETATSQQVFAANRQLQVWELRGRIGFSTGSEGHSGYLNWRQCASGYDLRINGPLGSGTVRLLGEPGIVTLYEGSNPALSAPTPEQLLADNYGWQLPLSQLHYWIRGIPNPEQPYQRSVDGFRQSGWHLQFPRQTSVDGLTLPAKAIADNGEARVTLVVQQWLLNPQCGGD